MSLKEDILAAARAEHIPAGEHRLWRVTKTQLDKPFLLRRDGNRPRMETLQPGLYTQLRVTTMATLHNGGEIVMEDTPGELHKHLNFMLRARGRVLISGLGLGCVARGCLANPAVRNVTIVERDWSVFKLVRPHLPGGPRCRVIMCDALAFAKWNRERYDCAWHDLWTDDGEGKEEHLQIVHMQLMFETARRVDFQGAWEFPRIPKYLMGATQKVIP